MKIFFYIPIFLVFVLNISSGFFVFKIQQYAIRKEIKHKIKKGVPNEQLHVFVLSPSAYTLLDWVRKDLEFRNGTEMFDIVRYERVNECIKIHCINDKEEAELFVLLDEMIETKIEQDSKNSNNPLSSIGKILKLVYLKRDFNTPLVYATQKYLLPNFAYLKNRYPLIFIEINTPPPDLV